MNSRVSEPDSDRKGPTATKRIETSPQRKSEPPTGLQNLQQHVGNQALQRMISVARKGEVESTAPEGLEGAIDRSRGGGRALEAGTLSRMNAAFDTDFSGVRIHTGADAHAMNQSINAKAFTTGQDIFFRHGEYNPGTSGGKELLAHELTHVVQQSGAVQGKREHSSAIDPELTLQTKLTVGAADDIYEKEADAMAVAYSDWERRGGAATDQTLQRQTTPEEEEEEKLQTKSVENGLQRKKDQSGNED